MSWLFCYYVDARYGYLFREPTPWFNTEVVEQNCPSAVFHASETHLIHKYGSFLKNFGLRTCMIIEVESQDEAVLMRLLNDQILNADHGTAARQPILQLVLEDPDWTALDALCEPLEAYKRLDPKRRGDVKATNLLQKQIDRMALTLEDLDGVVSEQFKIDCQKFADDSYVEIDRIRNENRVASSKATAARRALTKRIISYAAHTATPNLK